MWIHSKPSFNTTSTSTSTSTVASTTTARPKNVILAAVAPLASTSSQCSPSDPSLSSSCNDTPSSSQISSLSPIPNTLGGPGPALVPVADSTYNSPLTFGADPAPAPAPASSEPQPVPEEALATDIQHFGKRNFVGLLVLGLLAFLGLALWLTFGAWPRRTAKTLRAKLRRARGGEASTSGMGGGISSSSLRRAPCPETDSDAVSASDSDGTQFSEKVRSGIGGGCSTPSPSNSVEVEGLGKGLQGKELEAQERTLPRVRFA